MLVVLREIVVVSSIAPLILLRPDKRDRKQHQLIFRNRNPYNKTVDMLSYNKTVDVLSFGSKTRPEYQTAGKKKEDARGGGCCTTVLFATLNPRHRLIPARLLLVRGTDSFGLQLVTSACQTNLKLSHDLWVDTPECSDS